MKSITKPAKISPKEFTTWKSYSKYNFLSILRIRNAESKIKTNKKGEDISPRPLTDTTSDTKTSAEYSPFVFPKNNVRLPREYIITITSQSFSYFFNTFRTSPGHVIVINNKLLISFLLLPPKRKMTKNSRGE